MRTNIHFWSHIAKFFFEREMFRTKFAEETKIHILFSTIFFENRAIYGVIWKTTVEPNRSHMTIWRKHNALWISKVTHTIGISNTYFVSTATMVMVKLYVYCLPCLEIRATIFEANNTCNVAYNFLHFLLMIFCHVCIQ